MILGGNVNRVVLVGVQSLSFAGADIAGMTPIEDVFRIDREIRSDLRLV